MPNYKLRLLAIVAWFGGAVALSACGPSLAQSAKVPPPPPQIYTVTQRTIDGTVVLTDRAVEFHSTEYGCIRYRHPNDNAAIMRSPRVICGGLVSVKPEEK